MANDTPDSRRAAEESMRNHRLPEAIDAFREHLQQDPSDLKALLELGICHLLNGSEKLFLGIRDLAERLISAGRNLPAGVSRLWKRYCGLAAKVTAVALVAGSTAAAAYGQGSAHRYSGGVYFPPKPVVVEPPAGLPGEALPVPGAGAHVFTFGEPKAGDDVPGANVTAVVPPTGGDPREDWLDAEGRAEAAKAGVLRIKAFAGAEAGTPLGKTYGSAASARTAVAWEVLSGSLPEGTPVELLLDVHFDGAIYLYQDADADRHVSVGSAWGRLNLHRQAGDAFETLPSLTYSGAASFAGEDQWADGEWAGDMTVSPGLRAAGVDVDDRVTFGATVGEEMLIDFGLGVDASIFGDLRELVRVESDFSSSAWYEFAGALDPQTGQPLDVTVQVVPEPASLIILCLGALPAILRRRR